MPFAGPSRPACAVAVPLLVLALVLATVVLARPAAAAPGDHAAIGSHSFPATAPCDDSYAVAVHMGNTGTTTWTPTTHRLTVTGAGAPATVAVPGSVPPGGTAAFALTIDAPASTTSTTFGWQLSSDVAFGAAGTATVAVRCALDEAFRGAADFVEDTSFAVDRADVFYNSHGGAAHGETSTVDLGAAASPRYRMFLRSFVNPDGTKRDDGVPSGIAMATSIDGDRWNVVADGRPVFPAERSTPQFGRTDCWTVECLRTFYAPSVVVEGDGSLLMAHEVWDTGRDLGQVAPVWAIGFARSRDGGTTWTRVADPATARPLEFVGEHAWEGFDGTVHNGNVGTPDLVRVADGYRLSYHGWNGPLVRGLATGSAVDRLVRRSTPTMVPSAGWQAVGIGKSDDVREGDYLYRVYEAFRGTSGCMRADTTVGWGLARSADGGNSWETSTQNPIRVGRKVASCGDDLPGWQLVAGREPMVVTTDIQAPLRSRATLKRYRLTAARPAAPVSSARVVALATTGGGAGYWQLTARGEVFAFGTARSLGSAVASGRTDFVAMAARPDGNGYWLVTASGQVFAYGTAAALGQVSGQTVVAVQSSPSGDGYWLATSAGKVANFGDARSFGGLKKASSSPVAALTVRPAGDGYWLAAANGTVSAFGAAARFSLTSTAAGTPSQVVGMIARPDGSGYWLVGGAGRVWAHGTGTGDYGHGYLPVDHFRLSGAAARTVGSGTGKLTGGLADQTTGLLLVAGDGGVVDLGAAVDLGSVRGPAWAS